MSRIVALFSTLLLALFVCVRAEAQATPSSPPPVRDPNALAVIRQAVVALGGSAIGQVQDCVTTGTTQAFAGSGLTSGSFTWKNSGREFRYENPGPSGLRIFASGHGKPALEDGGAVMPLSPQAGVGSFPPHLLALVLVRALASPRVSVQMLGAGVVGGRPAIRVQVSLGVSTAKGGSSNGQQWFFDASSGLPLRVEYAVAADGAPGVTAVAAAEFSNYRPLSGVMIPFQIVTYADGQQMSVVTLSSVAFNTGIAASEFDLPTGGAQ